MSAPPGLVRLPDDLLLAIADYLSPSGFLSLLCSCRRLTALLPAYHRRSAKDPSALVYAACSPNPTLLSALLTAGADPDAHDVYGISALEHAARGGHTESINILIDGGARLEVKKGGRQPYPLFTPLDLAAKAGHVEALAHLYAALYPRYSDEEILDAVGAALCYAVGERRANVVEWLLQYTAPSQKKAQEALSKAVQLNAPNVAQLLLLAGADPNVYLPREQAAPLLHLCVERNRVELVVVLLEFGADVDARDAIGFTPMHYAVKSCSLDALVKLLVAGGDIDAHSVRGSPFNVAMRRNWARGLEEMTVVGLQRGWDVKERWKTVRACGFKSLDEAFLRAVVEVLGEACAAELMESEVVAQAEGENETKLTETRKGDKTALNCSLRPTGE